MSQDLATLGVGEGAETLVLSPQGKVEAYCRATMLADDVVLLDTESGYGEGLQQRLRRFRLPREGRARGRDHPLSAGPRACLGVEPRPRRTRAGSGTWRGPGRRSRRRLDHGRSGGVAGLRRRRPARWGRGARLAGGLPPGGDPAAFEAARIEAGVPAMGRELTEKTIPQEAGSLVEHTVSLTKGCFTGQELVARLDVEGCERRPAAPGRRGGPGRRVLAGASWSRGGRVPSGVSRASPGHRGSGSGGPRLMCDATS